MLFLSRRNSRRLDHAARSAQRFGDDVVRVAKHGARTAADSAAVRKGAEILETAMTGGSAALGGAVTTGSRAANAAVATGSDVLTAALAGGAGIARRPGPVATALRNIRTGRFQRSLSALTAVGSVITAAEIYFEHDRASFGNRMMWWPVVLGPVGAAAGAAGAVNATMARTTLPLVSALWVLNGAQGTYLHLRGVAQKPGGLRHNALFNIETGPPLLAPLLMTMVGGMGLIAGALRRER